MIFSVNSCCILILSNCQQSTFPDSKLPEVISFCKAEVMAHLLENLIGNTEAIITKKYESVLTSLLEYLYVLFFGMSSSYYSTLHWPGCILRFLVSRVCYYWSSDKQLVGPSNTRYFILLKCGRSRFLSVSA